MKKTNIVINVELDENHVPEKILWSAQDGGIENSETKAAMVSVWDSKTQEALRIDLWTKDMPLEEMKRFFHQVLHSLSRTYRRATGDGKASEKIENFANDFAKTVFRE